MDICIRWSALAGMTSTTVDMNVSADSCKLKDSVDSNCRGVLERAFAVMRAFYISSCVNKKFNVKCMAVDYPGSWHLAVKSVVYGQSQG